MKKILCLLMMFSTAAVTYSQQYFQKAQLLEDLDSLYLNLRKIHPDMFTFIPQEVFDRHFNDIKASLPDSLDKVGFFTYVAPLVNSMEDSHTSIYFPYPEVEAKDPFMLPDIIRLNHRTGSLYMVDGKLININGVPAEEIYDRLMSLSNGETWIGKAVRINYDFGYYYHLVDPSKKFWVVYTRKGKVKSKTVKGIKLNPNNPEPGRRAENIGFSEIEPGTVLCTIRSFEYFPEFQPYIDSMFQYLKENNIENLIMDIRGNTGGWGDMTYHIIRYISPVEFEQGEGVHIYRYRYPGQRYSENPEILATESVGDSLLTVYMELREPTQPFPQEERFHGDVYFLTNRGSMSASAMLAGNIKQYALGTIVGEETGGAYLAFGNPVGLSLPNTDMGYCISASKYFRNPEDVDRMRGVVPDVQVPPRQALDIALELIERKNW